MDKEITNPFLRIINNVRIDREWYRASGMQEDFLDYPPLCVWRFKVRDLDLEKKIEELVNAFEGQCNWLIYFRGRNWVLTLKEVEDYIENNNPRTDGDAFDYFAENYPEIGLQANKEIYVLSDFVEKGLKQAGYIKS